MKKLFLMIALMAVLSSTSAWAENTHFEFKTHKFDYTIPPKLNTLCQQLYHALPKEDRRSDEYCMRVDIDLVKTNYPFIDNILNGDLATEKGAQDARVDFDNEANDLYQQLQDKDNTQFNQFERYSKIQLISVAPNWVQIGEEDYEYLGGAHGMPSKSFYIFDLKNKKQLKIADILVSPSKKQALEKLVFAQFKNWVKKNDEDNGAKWTEQSFAEHQATWKFWLNDNFYFTPKGITFTYAPYALGSYAMGFAILNVDKQHLQGIVKDEYLNQRFEKFDDNQWSQSK